MSSEQYKKISGLILNHLKLDQTNSSTARDAIEPLSEIEGITELLKKYYKNSDFKTIVDNRFKNLRELITLVENKEAEKRLKKIEETENKVVETDTKQQEDEVVENKAVELDDINVEIENKRPSFQEKLTEMEQKLPPKLVINNENKGDGFLSYNEITDKEFCYKFLYCYLNNKDNQTDEIKAICKDIFNVYKIENDNPIDDFSSYTNNNIISNITFEVGFIINVETTKGGASAIPTQKRRPNKAKKSNRTIKERAKTR